MTASAPSRPAYRPDIDGLRAIAVAAVVVYHAFPSLLPGGFIGVDVFFVISGYLITALLLPEMETGTFSLLNFYARRARRLLPALVLVLAACLCAGWLLLDPLAYEGLGTHVVASAGFASNILLWRESGYFDVAAGLKPLLHLWSLGIEEQFYLLWPPLLWAAMRWRVPLLASTIALALLSLLLTEWLMRSDSAAAFYLPHARAWELLFGAMLAMLRHASGTSAQLPSRWSSTAAFGGLALVLASGALLDESRPFPGLAALPAVIGTGLLIAANPDNRCARTLLSGRAVVLLGRISYPLYLWHWPLLSISRLVAPDAQTPALRAALVATSLGLAWVTWRIVERPFRGTATRRWRTPALLVALALAGGGGAAVVVNEGFDGRVEVDVRRYATGRFDLGKDALMDSCWLGAAAAADAFADTCADSGMTGSGPLVLVWGDSHAARLSVGMRARAEGRFRVAQYTRDGCPPLFALKYARCIESNEAVIARVRALKPDVVVLFAFWATPTLPDRSVTLDALESTIVRAKAAGARRVIVVGPSAQWDGRERTLPANLLRLHAATRFPLAPQRMLLGVNPVAPALDRQYARRLSARSDVAYFSLYRAFCDARGCLTRVGDDPFDLVTWDYGHLTASGAAFAADRLEAAVGGFGGAGPIPSPTDSKP